MTPADFEIVARLTACERRTHIAPDAHVYATGEAEPARAARRKPAGAKAAREDLTNVIVEKRVVARVRTSALGGVSQTHGREKQAQRANRGGSGAQASGC